MRFFWSVPGHGKRSKPCIGPPVCRSCSAAPRQPWPTAISWPPMVRIALQGHQPFYAAIKAVHDTLKHLKDGGSPADLHDKVATDDLLNIALRQPDYARWQQDYLR